MWRTTLASVLGWTVVAATGMMVVGLAGNWAADQAVAAEPTASAAGTSEAPASPAATATETKPAASGKAKGVKAAKSKGRLPPYFSAVVTPELREKIYAIQAKYDPKISQLRQEIEALTKARDEKIYALLTPEQKQKIDELKSAARSARKATGEDKKQEKKQGKKPTKS